MTAITNLCHLLSLSLTISSLSVTPQVSANIALEAFLIRPSNFLGLSCTALQRPSSSAASPRHDSRFHGDKDAGRDGDAEEESLLNFKCHTVNSSGSPASQLSKVSLKLINGWKLQQICISTPRFLCSLG